MERRASRTASRWLSASAIFVLDLDPSQRRVRCDRGPGRAAFGQSQQALGDVALGPVQPRQEHAGTLIDGVGHNRALDELQLKRGVDHLRRDLEQLGGERTQLVGRQAAVAVIHRLGQREGDAGPGSDHRRLLDPEPGRDLVGALEADAADVAREPVGVFGDHLDGIRAVGLEDPHRPRGADAVAVQEQHDLADHLLVGPAAPDALGALGPDPGHLPQALGALLDGVEHALGERLDQLAGVDGADALDHAGAEIAFDALERGRRGGLEEGGLELEPVGPVVDPGAAGLDELAGADRGRGADHGHQLPLAADLDPQHAEAGLGAVEGDPLDQAGQGLALGRHRGWDRARDAHVMRPRSRPRPRRTAPALAGPRR